MAGVESDSVKVFVLPESAVGAKFTDTLEIDSETQLLYMGDHWTAGIDIFDISGEDPTYLETIPIRGQIFGIAIAAPLKKVYAGLARSTVAVIDCDPSSAAHNTIVRRIDVGGHDNTDLLEFDDVHLKIYAANRNEGFIVAIDAKTDTVVGRIEGLGGGLEQPRYNPVDGMVYLTCNTDNLLYQIDPETFSLVNTFDIVDACHPNGMAINPKTNQAILACSNHEHPHAVIWDLSKQEIATVIEDCGPGDGAAYAASVDRFFFAASGYPDGPMIAVIGGDPIHLIANVPSRRGASWVAFDDNTQRVYAPAIQSGRPALLSFRLPPAE